jgi:hypothetical protein
MMANVIVKSGGIRPGTTGKQVPHAMAAMPGVFAPVDAKARAANASAAASPVTARGKSAGTSVDAGVPPGKGFGQKAAAGSWAPKRKP